MSMKLLEGFNRIKGDICTPNGFTLDTFDYQLDCLNGSLSILIADNLCTVACQCSTNLDNMSFVNINQEHIQATKGISQAIIMTVSKNIFMGLNDVKFIYKSICDGLCLDDENVLVTPLADVNTYIDESFNIISNSINYAIQFNIGGIDCYIGVLKYQKFMCITTDVAITHDMLNVALNGLYEQSSKNVDFIIIMASGQAGNMAITKDNYIFNIFKNALRLVVADFYII